MVLSSARDYGLGGCVGLGYLRFCGESIEYREGEEALSEYLRRIFLCIESGGCAKGIIVSGIPAKIKRSNSDVYYSFLNGVLGRRWGGSRLYELEVIGIDGLISILKGNPELYPSKLEVVIDQYGVHLGVRKKDIVVIKDPRLDANNGKNRLTKAYFLQQTSPIMPYVLLYSISFLKGYRRLVYSLTTPPPSRREKCFLKGQLIECYRYRGSARCVFDRKVICPLRFIYRGPPRDGFGGALYHIDSGLKSLEKWGGGDDDLLHTDHMITVFLLSYLGVLSILSGRSLKQIVGFPTGEYDYSKLHEYIEKIETSSEFLGKQYPRLGFYLKILGESIQEAYQGKDPYQLRTRVMLAADSIPYVIRRLSSMVRLLSIYKMCRPERISPRVIEGYLKRFFPLLGTGLSGKVALRVAEALSNWGCVEPVDLKELVGEKMAERLLELLTKKNLLKRIPVPQGKIYSVR